VNTTGAGMDHSTTTGAVVRDGLTGRLNAKIVTEGSITLPAVPALLDDYTDRLTAIFATVGRSFTAEERTHLRSILENLLGEAYDRSQRSTITVSYRSSVAGPLSYTVTTHCMTIEEAYHHWIATREPPLFGVEPDARVWALAGAAEPAGCRVLDIGAGTGRNALALARRGHPVDVVEVTEKFADMIRQVAAQEALTVRVIQRDVFRGDDDLRRDYGLIILSEVVPEFRTTDELRRLFDLAAGCLAPGGRLVFNVFLANDTYQPDDIARQFAQQAYSGFITRAELKAAVAGLPLELVADDCVFDYEEANLPEGAWPPTSWYAGWVTGHDVFGLPRDASPVDMRWLVYRKPG
jgi:SAM-dependent methyltransferase